jgi:hypothetical protein
MTGGNVGEVCSGIVHIIRVSLVMTLATTWGKPKKIRFLFSITLLCTYVSAGQPLQPGAVTVSTLDIPRLFVMNEGQWNARITAAGMGPRDR